MQTPADAAASHEASIEIAASPEHVYDLVADITRMGEWSPENVGADWIDDGAGRKGDWFEGHNKSGDKEWTRACEVARADRGSDFTFVVGGVADNCTWWSYEMEPTGVGTRLTERWWFVNKTPGLQAVTEEQLVKRTAFNKTMLQDTIAAIKAVAEA